MATAHMFEYSKSSKASCNGPKPCKGTVIGLGDFRYGAVDFGPYGETVKWRHWGCVTPDILAQLANTRLERVPGFKSLRTEDQQKVRVAVATLRVDFKDIPGSAEMFARRQAKTVASRASQGTRVEIDLTQDSSSPTPSQPTPTQAAGSSKTQQHFQNQSRKALRPTQVLFVDDDDDDASQEEVVIDELYCTMSTSVVGLQYYEGLVGSGEEVRLIREIENKHDRNAIKVENIGRAQVGHIPRSIAAKLAPLMDQKLVTVEGQMNEGNIHNFSYSLSMTVKIYGAIDKRARLEPLLIWATPGQRGFAPHQGRKQPTVPVPPNSQYYQHTVQPRETPSYASRYSGINASTSQRASYAQLEANRKQQESLAKARELSQILNNLEKVSDEGRRSGLLDELCSTDDVLALPEHPSPPGITTGDLKVNLLKHQSQALQWCIDHEYPKLPTSERDKPVQFWQYRKRSGNKGYYFNLATNTPVEAVPELKRGALYADSMGLGKTLTMLALILTTKFDIPVDYSNTSLIVVPLSVLSNWEKQIVDHIQPDALTSCMYYGTSRNMTPKQMEKHDIVITTYQTVAKEFESAGNRLVSASQKRGREQGGLFDVRWKRIVLDEGHNIRNPKTKMAKAVCGLEAQRRWVLTGTPIINSPKDLGSVLTFLRICHPLNQEDYFHRLLLRPLKNASPAGADLLKALMSHVCIRRTKEMQDSEGNHLVPLPPVDITVVPVTLHENARDLYDEIEDIASERVDRMLASDGGAGSTRVTSNVLTMLTRLRQLALHPGLVPHDYLNQLRGVMNEDEAASAAPMQLNTEDKFRLQKILAQAIEDCEECPICFDTLDQPRITNCAHRFCLACITEVLSRDPKCPMDRRPLTISDLIEPSSMELTQLSMTQKDEASGVRAGSSAKIDQLIHLLNLQPSTEKALVFSQFTSFLDKIAETLEAAGIPYVRFDGTMSAKRRQETIVRFSVPLEDDESPALLLTQAPSNTPHAPPRRVRSSLSLSETANDVNDQDEDYVAGGDESDDDFIVNDTDDERPAKKRKTKNKGKAKAKDKGRAKKGARTGSNRYEGVNPKVMLISLKAGALGLNLTVANNVYMMDPWWQEGIESQAIDRCNRIGQTKPVHVYQLIAEGTIESKVIEIQEKKKLLVKQAFSGIKSKETERQKKQAKLQDLIELFRARKKDKEEQSGNEGVDGVDGPHQTNLDAVVAPDSP